MLLIGLFREILKNFPKNEAKLQRCERRAHQMLCGRKSRAGNFKLVTTICCITSLFLALSVVFCLVALRGNSFP